MYYGYGFGYGLLDPTMILVYIGVILTMWASSRVNTTFRRYAKVRSMTGMTGAEAAKKLLHSQGIYDVTVQSVRGQLTDHYDPRTKTVNLSEDVYGETSVAALGVAAHECGHAVQHAQGYVPIKVRSAVFPLAQIGSSMYFIVFILGLIFSFEPLVDAGIILFLFVVVFQLVTLPVEFNASRRAMQTISSEGILEQDELYVARRTLTAAAMTYVASLAVSFTQLLRLLAARNRR